MRPPAISKPMISRVSFPFPFIDFDVYIQDGDTALTLVDLRMIELSYLLRSKPSWWIKIKDPAVRSQWKAEALEYQIRGGKLKEAEIEWVIDEIEDYAKMRDEATGIQPSCHVRIWEADNLIPEDLKANLIRAGAVLENVPDEEKDWHSRYSDQVLNLVHPSLFCAVYGRTPSWNNSNNARALKPLDAPPKGMAGWAYSSKFAWIPTDFQLGENGAPATALGYINNVHPSQNKDLVTALESLVGRFSLLWDRVLTDIHPDNHSLPRTRKVVGSYTWTDHPKHPKPSWYRVFGRGEFNKRLNSWQEHKILSLPTVDKHGYRGSGQDITRRNTTYSIQGKIVQVIIKLANIHLTPDKPEFPGGSWHVEGMANERIVASSIYYYDCENITDSELSFRIGVSFTDAAYEDGDERGVLLTWGLKPGEPTNQVVGATKTCPNRCIAFPNMYQHKLSSFKLADPTKPGHRKIVALFLVDPENRIPSTSDIPPQQSHWARNAIFDALVKDNDKMKAPLPVELVDMVADHVDTVMTLAEAKAYREEFMKERTAFADVVDEQHFSTDFDPDARIWRNPYRFAASD